jgi:hydroxyacylglutathione hydrolase
MEIKKLIVSLFEVNCYLVWGGKDKVGVIVDPGDEDETIIDNIGTIGFKPGAILLTHGHGDHIGAVKPIKEKYDIPIYIGREDAPLLESPSANFSSILGHEIACPPADHLVDDNDRFKIGPLDFTVLSTPGHTRGGVCYFVDNILFCGDTLFQGSIGRTDLSGGDYHQLITSIEKKILTLPEDIICYPGHGPKTTVGAEKRNNPFLAGNRFV